MREADPDLIVQIEAPEVVEIDATTAQALPLPPVPVAILPVLALAACGDGGTAAAPPAASPPPPPPAAVISSQQASRFLGQATMGATKADIAEVQSLGYDAWLTAQFAKTRATSHYDWMVAQGYQVTANINGQAGFDPSLWRQMIVEPDQLRQRIGMALLDFLVISIEGVPANWRAFNAAAYVDLLLDNAFTNYRTILDKITTSTAMGSYLTFLGNRKANTATGSVPDENYARELMQLFTIGLYKIDMDGTQLLSAGKPQESYVQADVSQLARVFTGFTYDSSDTTTPERYRRPMVINAALHETGASSFLGANVPAGTDGAGAVKIALDTLFAHPNLPPFVSKQLIQRLVTSNPSPGYVRRVATVFADNGSGVRGDMKAIIRAILTDGEARGDTSLTSTSAGKLRAPVNRLTNWARAFGVTSASNNWAIGNTSSSANRLAQSTGHSPSVFNFFRPGYTPPNTAIATQNLVAPEFQITNELSIVAYINYMQSLLTGGVGDVRASYTEILTKASDSQALVDEVNLVLAAGQLGTATLATLKTAVDSISATVTNGPINRVYTAILLTLASPEYITVK
jgi:uncharacterized protein (DUF1800 family)